VLAPLLTEKDDGGFSVAHYAAKGNDVKVSKALVKITAVVQYGNVHSDSIRYIMYQNRA
jgi:hypothetical protein